MQVQGVPYIVHHTIVTDPTIQQSCIYLDTHGLC